jgi:hypothetical protein
VTPVLVKQWIGRIHGDIFRRNHRFRATVPRKKTETLAAAGGTPSR